MKRLRIPYFKEIVSFNAADMVRGETIRLIQSARSIGEITTKLDTASYTRNMGLLSAGLFGGSGNVNQNTPNETAQTVVPQPEDFVNVPYRFISATMVGAHSWKASDFSTVGVLKESLELFRQTPIYSDHVQTADNFAGIVTDPYYQEGFTDKTGQLVPSGINGNASIDVKTNYNLARGILMGAIGSNSVTVRFDWEPSHLLDSLEEFYNKLGEVAKDGKMIARKVRHITQYYETSMLFAGADPFSKRLDENGHPIKVDRTAVYFSKADPTEKADYEKEKKMEVAVNFDKELISLSKGSEKTDKATTPKANLKMNKFLLAFIAAFGQELSLSFTNIPDTELTDAQQDELTRAIAKLSIVGTAPPAAPDAKTTKIVEFANALKFVNDKGEVSAFAPETASGEYMVMLKATKEASDLALKSSNDLIAAQASKVILGESFIKAQQDEAIRLAKLAAGDKFDEATTRLIISAPEADLPGLLKSYGAETTLKYAPKCTKCNSGDSIEMRSTFVPPVSAGTEGPVAAPFNFEQEYRNSSTLFR